MPVLGSRAALSSGWLLPEGCPLDTQRAAAAAAASIKLTSAHISNHPVLTFQRQRICQICLCANPVLREGLEAYDQPRKRSSLLLCILRRWPETIIKKEQRDYKLICPHQLLWLQRYYKPRICKSSQFLSNLRYHFYHCVYYYYYYLIFKSSSLGRAWWGAMFSSLNNNRKNMS